MKQVISALALVSLGLATKLNIGLTPRLIGESQTAYDLSCDGAQGNVRYYVDGVPSGVTFDGDSIIVTNSAAIGNFSVRITAVDEAGVRAERVITLSISQVRSGGQGSAGGVAQGGVAGGVAQGGSGGVVVTPGGGGSGSTGPGGARLDSILSTTTSTTTVTRPNYGPSGRFPDSGFPTGADPTIPNYTPTQIASNNARPTDANRVPITPDDVALRAASDRHQNSIKGITNLITIIDQARANRDKAQGDIQPYTQAYNDAVAAQRAAQNDVIGAETRVSQITVAITQLTSQTDDLRNRINEAVAQNDKWNREKTTVTTTITGWQTTKAGLLETLKKLDTQVAGLVRDLSNKNAECSSINDSINNKQRELTNAQNDLINFQNTRSTLVVQINGKAANVDDLRRRLQLAEKDLADSKIRLADLESRAQVLPGLIANVRRELEDLQARARACADQVARIQAAIKALQGDRYSVIRRDIDELDSKITVSRTRVSEIDAALAASAGPLADLRSKLTQATDDLTFIRTQRFESENSLRNAYQRGNDSNNRVAFARQNLDAVVKRFQDESRIVSDATLNLERARAEQALARTALNEFVYSRTDALPYAIVPNGLGNNPGTPNGNNPSGSPLGPVRTNGNGAPGSFRISNWTNYLSTAYGAGVSPASIGSVNQLFPFNFFSGVSGNMGQGTTVVNGYGDISGFTGARGGCRAPIGTTGQVVTSGVVVSVSDNSFDVKGDDGAVTTVGVAPCSRLAANQQNYKLQQGDSAYVKGWRHNGRVVADHATCVRS